MWEKLKISNQNQPFYLWHIAQSACNPTLNPITKHNVLNSLLVVVVYRGVSATTTIEKSQEPKKAKKALNPILKKQTSINKKDKTKQK